MQMLTGALKSQGAIGRRNSGLAMRPAGRQRLAGLTASACENRRHPERSTLLKAHSMDVEHINAIGNTLADLTKRTVDLRGYL